MYSETPKVDARDADAIVEELRELAPYYVPELSLGEGTNPGAALVRIFAKFLEGILHRLNEAPQESFVAFLDTLGIQLSPAQPARAPLTFSLSSTAKEGMLVPQRTQVTAAPADGGDPVVFETERAILATPAILTAVISVVPSRDQIVDHTSSLAAEESAEFFADDDSHLQEHAFYLGHDDIFNVKSSVSFVLKIKPSATEFSSESLLGWDYCTGEADVTEGGVTAKVPQWQSFTKVYCERQSIVLTKENDDEIGQATIYGVKARWIRCRVKGMLGKNDALANLSIKKVSIGFPSDTSGASQPPQVCPDAACCNDIPLALPASTEKPLSPFGPRPRQGDVFYIASQEAFSKKGSLITIGAAAYPGGAKGMALIRVHGIGTIYAERLRENGICTTTDLIKLTSQQVAEFIRKKEQGEEFPASRYIAFSKNIIEAASKAYYDKVVSAGGAEGDDSYTLPQLSWEYWNGKGWTLLQDLVDDTGKLMCPGTITFTCPTDIAETTIGGIEDYWIRTRIVYGNYGEEKFSYDSTTNTLTTSTSGIHPPLLRELTISYNVEETPTSIVTLNNLDYSVIETTPFSPFVALSDKKQTIYLGFDQAPLKGAISLFFSLEELQYQEGARPRLEWQYYRLNKLENKGEWSALVVTDETKALTEGGTIEFYGPSDFTEASLFGQSLFWIRVVDVEEKFQPSAQDVSANVQLKESAQKLKMIGRNVRLRQKQMIDLSDESDEFRPPFFLPSSGVDCPAPVAEGIYLNTTWAVQAETIEEEILGSSTGAQDQTFALTKIPVMEEELWIDEFSSLTESERKLLSEAMPDDVNEVTDDEGTVTEFWVCWKSVDDLAESAVTDRVYAIDRTFGKVQFGDGVNGKIPPLGKDNIVATYRSGGGSIGNVDALEVSALRTTLASVEKVSNPIAAGGGSDTELLEDALERGPWSIKSCGRAVTAEDFEWLTREASRAVARVKCLSDFNNLGQFATGWVTVIIVPQGTGEKPVPSLQLRKNVQQYLADRCANLVAYPMHVYVTGPTYVEVEVLADLVPRSIDLAPQIEEAALQAVRTFLHPLTGGYEGRGWEFGRLPALSDFYELLEGIDGVDHVAEISLTLQAIAPTGTKSGAPRTVDEGHPLDVRMPEYTLIYSGDHLIKVVLST